jgi:hypothetical protein
MEGLTDELVSTAHRKLMARSDAAIARQHANLLDTVRVLLEMVDVEGAWAGCPPRASRIMDYDHVDEAPFSCVSVLRAQLVMINLLPVLAGRFALQLVDTDAARAEFAAQQTIELALVILSP